MENILKKIIKKDIIMIWNTLIILDETNQEIFVISEKEENVMDKTEHERIRKINNN